MKGKPRIRRALLVFFLFCNAVAFMSYPYIANYVFEHRVDSIVTTMEKSEKQVDDEKKEKMKEAVTKYNEVIYSGRIQLCDPFKEGVRNIETEKYDSLLDTKGNGIMGTISIPAIDVKLPIYHGTSEKILEKGVGHLEGSSLPMGGENTHTVLTGHTGLSNAKLFTDLTEMEKGEIFFLNVLGDKLAYQVDQIKVVMPTELEELYVKKGEDYCTLVTCTPYGVNTHRLLVRGTRIDMRRAVQNPGVFSKKHVESKWMEEYGHALKISLEVFIVGAVVLYFYQRLSNKRKKKKGESCV